MESKQQQKQKQKQKQRNKAGMHGAAVGGSGGRGPVGPDVTACKGQFCPPFIDQYLVRDFKFEDYPNPVTPRVRRPAQRLDQDSIDDFKRATSVMKSLPPDDPRNFLQQANVHGAYCMGAYPVAGNPGENLMVHGNWLFAPFHRWYIYFLERIMGKLIDKPSFALPYWNWDHPEGMRIPDIFKDVSSPLYNPNRDEGHIYEVMDLSYRPPCNGGGGGGYPYQDQVEENLLTMRKQVQGATKPVLFFGGRYPSPDVPTSFAGALEACPHNNVHNWTGDPTFRGGQDMGILATAGRDPIFYCHHANVDRLWSLWRTHMPDGPRRDLDDPDYLDSSFIFYDECARPVRVYIRDSLDTDKLGYIYEEQELPWVLPPHLVAVPHKPKPKTLPLIEEVILIPKRLDSVITTKVARPRPYKQQQEEEVLLIMFQIQQMVTRFTKFDVYVNDDSLHQVNEKTQVKPEFTGSFTMVPHEVPGAHGDACGNNFPMNNKLMLPITMLLDEIGASSHDELLVTIVPISAAEHIFITDHIQVVFVA